MRKKIQILLTLIFMAAATFSQQIQRIDGSTITADSLAQKITYLMRAANVSGVAISVFNDNNPVYSQTFGYANVPGKTLWTPNSELYACSLSKAVFAYVVMHWCRKK